jgi:hypothetical protein
MKKVFFVTNYMNALAPVIRVLKDKNDPDIRIIVFFPPQEGFDGKFNLNGNLEYRNLGDFIDIELTTKIKNSLIEFGERIRRFETNLSLSGFSQIEISNCDWRLIKEDYFNFAFRFFSVIPALKRAFEVIKPDLVCGACEPSAATVVSFKLARARKIPTLLIQHGRPFIKPLEVFWRCGLTGENLHNIDKMAIWGEISHEELIGVWGTEIEHKLVITGSPKLDFYFDLWRKSLGEEKIRFCRHLGLDHRKKLIILALCSRWRDIAFVIKEVWKAIRQFPECQLVLRIHPSDPFDIYQKICEDLKIKIPIIKGEMRDESDTIPLRICEVVVATPTVVGIEALLLKKPVISFHPPWQTHLTCPYAREGAAIEVKNGVELKNALEYILYRRDDYEREFSHNIKKYISREIYKFDGRASERVCILIKEMMRD